MTKDEALKQALEVIEAIHTVGDVACVVTPNGTIYLQPAITTIKEALDECDEDELIIRYHEMTIKRLEKRIEELTVQPKQEPVAWEQFHEHMAGSFYTHPPQRPWVGLTETDILAASRHWRHAEDFMAGVYWAAGTLKEKNT